MKFPLFTHRSIKTNMQTDNIFYSTQEKKLLEKWLMPSSSLCLMCQQGPGSSTQKIDHISVCIQHPL